MAQTLKTQIFSISTDEDLVTLEEFLTSVGSNKIEYIVHVHDQKVLVVYEE